MRETTQLAPHIRNDSHAIEVIRAGMRYYSGPLDLAEEVEEATNYCDIRMQEGVEYERRWNELVETTATRIAQGVGNDKR